MKQASETEMPVTIGSDVQSWQIFQQNRNGVASITLHGRWWTVMKRKRPEVLVTVSREGCFSAISRKFFAVRARTEIDAGTKGDAAGRWGRWHVTLKGVPAGGPYRIETSVGSVEDAVEWRRGGEVLHFVGVGDLWLITGQSNAEGYGRGPGEDPSELGVHSLAADGQWTLAAQGRRHNPWLAFAKRLKRELGYPIGLIPTAVGGSEISSWDPAQKGPFYANMVEQVKSAGGRIKGVVWYQGESDAEPERLPKYKARFQRFVAGVRRAVKADRLPVITVQLNRVMDGREDEHWEAMREIQRQLSHEVKQVFIVAAFDAVLTDMIHNGALGNMVVADRAGATALGAVYGRDMLYRHPECVRAQTVGRKAIKLTFDHVSLRLLCLNHPKNGLPFAVRDREGDVTVMEMKQQGKNRIRLLLARGLVGDATVTGVPGACAPHVVPQDVDGNRCMLAFTRVVETRKQ